MNIPNLNNPAPFGFGQRKVNERTRIIMMCVALAVFGIGYLWLRSQKLSVEGGLDPDDIVVVPQDEQLPMQRVPSARVDAAKLEGVKDATLTDRLVREPEAYQHLLTEARKLTHGDLEALGMKPIDATAIRSDPAIHRGRPYFVRGILESIDVSFDPEFHEIRGIVKDLGGQRYAFSVLAEPEVAVGNVVKLEGYFFKLLAHEIGPGEYDQDVIHLVGKRLMRSYFELPPNDDLAKIPFFEARDADLAEQVAWPDDLLYQTLNWVRTIGKEKAAALEGETVDYAQLRKEPDRYRGKVVRVFGNFYLPLEWQRRLGPDGENPLGHDLFHEGLLKLPHDRLYRWIGFDGVPKEFVSSSRLVALKGVFIKNVAWQNTRSDAISGPLLVVTGFEPFQVPDESSVKVISYAVAALTVLCIGLFLFGVYNDQKKAKEFQKEYMRRKRRQFDRAQQQAATSGPRAGEPGN